MMINNTVQLRVLGIVHLLLALIIFEGRLFPFILAAEFTVEKSEEVLNNEVEIDLIEAESTHQPSSTAYQPSSADIAYRNAPETITVEDELILVRLPAIETERKDDYDGRKSLRIEITRPFYLGTKEVSVGAFKKFKSEYKGEDSHPVNNIFWDEAARFCNWLSKRHKLEPFYQFNAQDITVLDEIKEESLGFRLPSEFEWEIGAAYRPKQGTHRLPYEWGPVTAVPIAFANLAGREASEDKTRHLRLFVDNHKGIAPVGSYLPNHNGLYDMTGNVSEWVHDFYVARRELNGGPNYMGPRAGFAHVVKGANFRTYETDELPIYYRDFETTKQETIGFRIARWIH